MTSETQIAKMNASDIHPLDFEIMKSIKRDRMRTHASTIKRWLHFIRNLGIDTNDYQITKKKSDIKQALEVYKKAGVIE